MPRPKIKVSVNQQRSIVSRYKKGEGLVAISNALKLGVGVVRRVLADGKIKIRKRGRPRLAD